MTYTFSDNELTIVVSKSLYSEAVVYKCFYWYTGKYRVRIMEGTSEQLIIRLGINPDNCSDEDLEYLKDKISQDLVDFKLRDLITLETKTVRELLIAKAFMHEEIAENPESDISDPLGFKPEDIHINE